jgi:formylglycine-generating enzyme required for sulfatase activity
VDTGYDTLTPLEAYHEVMRFAAQRGEQVLRLAFHAAVPQVLRPDLLHLLRLNFVTESLDDPAAEADVLFATFCAELGNGYFRFKHNARLQLLTQLDPAYAEEAALRSRQVAGFVLAYCDRQGSGLTASNDLVYAAYLEVERWVALAFFDPDAAASQLAAAVKQSCEEGAVAARMRIGGLASALATPLARHPDLLTYAAGVEALEAGDFDRAEDLLQPLGEREIQVGGVTLRSPRSLLREQRSRKRTENTELPPEEVKSDAETGKQRPNKPSLIYISSSRRDNWWVQAVRSRLGPLESRYGVALWTEAQIASGRQWERDVSDAIDRAKVAIVLLSPAYLASEMRMHDELQRLVERARKGSLYLAWTCVERCDWKQTPLEGIQAVHDPDKPLTNLTLKDQERALAQLAAQVAAFLEPASGEDAQEQFEAKRELQPRGRVFLVYRRDDAAGYAGRLRDRLRQRFGDDRVFMDIRDIPPGRDFSQVIDREVSTAAAIVVVIGPRWVDARNEDGQRQLDNPHDFLRQEVAAALSRGIPVIPVLVGEARMPSAESLPDDLVPLTRCNAIELRDGRWDVDCARLFEAIEPSLLSSGTVFRDCDDCPEMVVVPAGTFMMGEGPQHKVTIARPFAVGKYPVTFDEWDACVNAGGTKYEPVDSGWGRGKRPVINVSWDDAQVYVAWLSKKTGMPYRLLSEAEWEYAARAGTTTRYPWGDEPDTNHANFRDSGSQWSGKQTAPVGSFEPNAFGLHDMIGNVWEWLQDCWNNSYSGAPTDGSAWEAGDCGRRVVRGGSWDSYPENARVADRSGDGPTVRYFGLGFRLARTL